MKSLFLPFVVAVMATPALADLEVRFDEGAPKDRFTIANTGDCALGETTVTIDLSGSASGLIFDVTDRGAGVEVFQPFDLVSGRDLLASVPQVEDGDSSVVLTISRLETSQTVAFTIDVDDTSGQREITVSGSEISGAGIRVDGQQGHSTGTFGPDAIATAPLTGCTS